MFSSVGGGVDTIRAWVDRIRMSADRLIVSENAIRIFAMTYIPQFGISSSSFSSKKVSIKA